MWRMQLSNFGFMNLFTSGSLDNNSIRVQLQVNSNSFIHFRLELCKLVWWRKMALKSTYTNTEEVTNFLVPAPTYYFTLRIFLLRRYSHSWTCPRQEYQSCHVCSRFECLEQYRTWKSCGWGIRNTNEGKNDTSIRWYHLPRSLRKTGSSYLLRW